MVKRKYSQSGTFVKRRRLSTRARAAGAVARRRFTGRRIRMSRGRIGSLNVHRYRRWAATDQRLSGTTGAGFADTFMLNKLPNYTEFDTLYDRYMITTVVVKIQLISNPDASYFPANTTTLNADNYYPKLWYYPDYDDDTAPTTLDET